MVHKGSTFLLDPIWLKKIRIIYYNVYKKSKIQKKYKKHMIVKNFP